MNDKPAPGQPGDGHVGQPGDPSGRTPIAPGNAHGGGPGHQYPAERSDKK